MEAWIVGWLFTIGLAAESLSEAIVLFALWPAVLGDYVKKRTKL